MPSSWSVVMNLAMRTSRCTRFGFQLQLAFDPQFGGLKITNASPKIDLGTIDPPVEKRGIRLRLAKPKPAKE